MKLLWWLFGWTFRDWRFWRQYQVTSFTLSGVGALHPGVVVLVRQKAREIWLPAAPQPQELMEVHRLLDSRLLVPRWTHGTFDMRKLQASAHEPARGRAAPAASFSLSEVGSDPIQDLMLSENLSEADAEKLPEPDFEHIEFLPTKPAA